MARKLNTLITPELISELFREQLKASGINARVTAEKIRGTFLFRISVRSKALSDLYLREQQDLLWRVANRMGSFLTAKIVSIITI